MIDEYLKHNKSKRSWKDDDRRRRRRWKERLAGRTLEDITPAELEHLRTVKERGGWKTLSMVQRYAHLSPGHRHAAFEQLVKRKAESYKARAGGME